MNIYDFNSQKYAKDRSKRKPKRLVRSVERALGLMELLASTKGKLRLNRIASEMNLNISTCHHLLSTLVEYGYVGHTEDRAYYLGNKVLELSRSRIGQFNLVDIARNSLRKLNEKTGETVHLAELQDDKLITINVLESHHPVRVISGPVGKNDAIHATATGKAILAWLPEREIKRILDLHGMEVFTESTITDQEVLVEELRMVRRNGFAMDLEEFQPGVVCIGAAIRDQTGSVVGSFSCSLPEMRASETNLREIQSEVKEAATDMSAVLSKTVGNGDGSKVDFETKNYLSKAS